METPKVRIGRFDLKGALFVTTGVQIETSDGTFTLELRGREGWIQWSGGDLEIEDWPKGSDVRWHGSGYAFDIAE